MSKKISYTQYEYPNFKPVGLEDKEVLENFLANYPPYCDFTFSNLHLWQNYEFPNEYCFLNQNLVIKTINNNGNQQIVSVLGKNEIDKTIAKLVGDNLDLHYIPDMVVNKMSENLKNLLIAEDLDNSDYVFDLGLSSTLEGPLMYKKRSEIKRFKRKYPNIKLKELSLEDEQNLKSIKTLFQTWLSNNGNDINESAKLEYASFKEFVNNSKHINHLVLGFFDEGKLIGFHIIELLHNKWALSHFAKGIKEYKELYNNMFHEVAKHLYPDFQYINYQMDLGNLSLRSYKQRWRPYQLLKKYRISKKNIDTINEILELLVKA